MESMVVTAKRAKDTVSDYLRRRGMEIVDDKGVGTTDFVAWDSDSLVFVTVVVRLHGAEDLPDAEEERSHRTRAERDAGHVARRFLAASRSARTLLFAPPLAQLRLAAAVRMPGRASSFPHDYLAIS